MKLISDIKPVGIFKIFKIYPNGEKILVFHEENLITLATKVFILSGIYLPAITSDQVTTIRFGTGGTIDPEGFAVKPEDPAQTNLHTPLLNIATSHQQDLTVPSVTFLADMDQSTGNGNLVTEAGLVTALGNLFNVKNFPGIPKTSEFSLHTEWTIKIA